MTIKGWDRATPWRIMIMSATEWRGPSKELDDFSLSFPPPSSGEVAR